MSRDHVSDHMVYNFKIKFVLESNKQQAGKQTCQHHMYAVVITYSVFNCLFECDGQIFQLLTQLDHIAKFLLRYSKEPTFSTLSFGSSTSRGHSTLSVGLLQAKPKQCVGTHLLVMGLFSWVTISSKAPI